MNSNEAIVASVALTCITVVICVAFSVSFSASMVTHRDKMTAELVKAGVDPITARCAVSDEAVFATKECLQLAKEPSHEQ